MSEHIADIDKHVFKNKLGIENPVIFDVGCFDGNDCLEFIEIFENPKLYAFEADKRSIEIFKNHVGNVPVTLIETALSNRDGHVDFYKSESKTRKHDRHGEKTWTASSSIKKPENHLNIFPDVQFMDKITVESQRLDTWIEDKNISKIDIMWVDVNGGEKEFLDGALNTINNKVKYLYIEFNAADGKSLYEGCLTKDEIKNKLPNFKECGVFNFMGNFGNVLLENQS